MQLAVIAAALWGWVALQPPPEGADGQPLPPPPDPAPLPAVDSTGTGGEDFGSLLLQGQEALRAKRYEEAIRVFTAALELQRADPEALVGRARARRARVGKRRCAASAVRDLLTLRDSDPKGAWVAERATAHAWLKSCGLDHAEDRLSVATELARLEPATTDRPEDVWAQVAQMQRARMKGPRARPGTRAYREARDAAIVAYQQYQRDAEVLGFVPTAEALHDLATLLLTAERTDEALAAFREVSTLHRGHELGTKAREAAEKIVTERELKELQQSQGGLPTPEAQRAFDAGLRATERRDWHTAEAQLSAAIEASPWFSKAYYYRGVVRTRLERFEDAVSDLNMAVLRDRSDYNARMRLAAVYMKEFGGTEDAKAIEHYEAVLRLRPDLHQIHLRLGKLYAREDRERARDHYEQFLRLRPPDDEDAAAAAQALAELDRDIEAEPPPVLELPQDELRLLPKDLERILARSFLLIRDDQWDRAEKLLRKALTRFPDQPVLYNKLAEIAFAQRRAGEARRQWELSLEIDAQQREVHERLGLLLAEAMPEQAQAHLERAANLGSSIARFTLAEMKWRGGSWWEAAEQLEKYRATADRYDLHWDRAQELHDEVQAVLLRIKVGVAILGALVVLVPLWLWYRRVRGFSLGQFLERKPKSFPEVARTLSLIRHEILKHNTAFLSDVGQLLEMGSPDADIRAALLGHRLFGRPGREKRKDRKGHEVGGVYGRFLGYLEELQQVARSHGHWLNLYRKDPIFRPIVRAFENLADHADALRTPGKLRVEARAELGRLLRRTGEDLGQRAFADISSVLRELCVVDVTHDFVREVWSQVRGEAQFEGASIAELELGGDTARIRVFQTDLEDIIANVLRNSLRSSLQDADPPIAIGVQLVREVDDITGLGSLAIRILDRSPERLSNEMLRGRYVERGMGITVDLLSRYDGAIAVESEPGWEKAVVLRFFTLDEETA